MFKASNYYTRATIKCFVMLLFTIMSGKAQHGIALNMGMMYGFSWLTFNQKSENFDKRLGKEKIAYHPIQNIGMMVGATAWLTPKVSLQVMPRWQQWGGTITVQSNEYTTQMLKMEINYQGLKLPAQLQYALLSNEHLQLNLALGAGIEYTYNLWFVPTNYYGSAPVQRRTVDIVAPFATTGINVTYTAAKNKKTTYMLGLYYETDAFFNPVRYNEYAFWQRSVPLLSHQLYSSLQIQYHL